MRKIKKSRRALVLFVAVATLSASLALAALASPGSKSTSDVYWFGDNANTVGDSTLRRTNDGVRMRFKSNDIGRSEAITIWWVVFNEPENCSAPGCGEDDIFVGGDPAAGLDLQRIVAADVVAGYAGGKVSSAGGKLNIDGRLDEGELGPEVIFGDGPLLKDANAAEIHLVARSHGPAIPGLEADQTGSFAGGCDMFLNPPARPSAAGECVDVQFAVHLP